MTSIQCAVPAILLAAIGCARAPVTAGATPQSCDATHNETATYFPRAPLASHADTAAWADSVLIPALSGTFQVLEVQTEGRGERRASVWRLRLGPRMPGSAPPCIALDCGTRPEHVPLIGAAELPASDLERRYRDRFAESTDPEKPGAWVRYDSRRGRVLLALGLPLRVDANQYYTILSLGPAGFSGRWVDGGYAVALVPMPTGHAIERSQGYFCAFRIHGDGAGPA